MKAKDLIKKLKEGDPNRPVFYLDLRPNDIRQAIEMQGTTSALLLHEQMNWWDEDKLYAFVERVFHHMMGTANMYTGWNWKTIGEMAMAVYEEDRSEWN